MRILIVTQYFWPETFRINDLALDLKKNGHDVTVLTGIPNYPHGSFFKGYGYFRNRREIYHGVSVLRVPLIARKSGSKLRLIMNYLSFAFFGMLLGPFICRGKFDVIFVFEPSPVTVGLPAIVMKKVKRAPILFWVQDLWPENVSATGGIRNARVLSWIRRLTTYIYKKCDRILVQSKAFIPSIVQQGISPQKIVYFPNAAEDLYSIIPTQEECRSKIEKLPDGFRIVYAGNVGVAQSFETILEAAILLKDIKEIKWIIIGDGRQKTWLMDQITQHDLKDIIYLIDQKPVETMPYYFAMADALLVSLKKDPVFSLTIPSKLQSYLACGKPIIAALDGEAARITQESKSGYVGDAGNSQMLAQNVLELYKSSVQNRFAMGSNGRKYFEKHFEKQKLLEILQDWISELVVENKFERS